MSWSPDPRALSSYRPRKPRKSPVPHMWRIPVITTVVIVALVLVFLTAERAAAASPTPPPPTHPAVVALALAGLFLVGLLAFLLPLLLRELDPRPRYHRTPTESGEEVPK